MGFVDDELSKMKDVIANLESRVKRLEGRQGGSATADEIRMILIGPPGAGTWSPRGLASTCCRSQRNWTDGV